MKKKAAAKAVRNDTVGSLWAAEPKEGGMSLQPSRTKSAATAIAANKNLVCPGCGSSFSGVASVTGICTFCRLDTKVKANKNDGTVTSFIKVMQGETKEKVKKIKEREIGFCQCTAKIAKEKPISTFQAHVGQSRASPQVNPRTGGRCFPSNSTVFPPSRFDPSDEEHLNSVPNSHLILEWIYTYQGQDDARDNLYFLGKDNPEFDKRNLILFFAAGTAVVFDVNNNYQYMYNGHNDNITSLALHNGQMVVATGQVGKNPRINVWSAMQMQTLCTIEGFHQRAVTSLAFSVDGTELASVGADDNRSVAVYRFPRKKGGEIDYTSPSLMFNAVGQPALITSCRFNPYCRSSPTFVTSGDKHLRIWEISKKGEGDKGMFKGNGVARNGVNQTVFCLEFIPGSIPPLTVGGTADGSIYFWRGSSLNRIISDAHKGATTALCLFVDRSLVNGEGECCCYLVSGGKDGKVRAWDIGICSNCPLSQPPKKDCEVCFGRGSDLMGEVNVAKNYCPTFGGITAIDERNGMFLVGTSSNCIIMFHSHFLFSFEEMKEAAPYQLILGHSGVVNGLATHSDEERRHLFVTASDDRSIRVWDMKRHKMISHSDCGVGASCVAISPSGRLYALGHIDGTISVWESSLMVDAAEERKIRKMRYCLLTKPPPLSHASREPFPARTCPFDRNVDCTEHSSLIFVSKGRNERIFDVKFSPNGKHLAAACGDNFIDIYAVPDGDNVVDVSAYRRTGVCSGHSSFVMHIDFSHDGKLLQSNAAGNEHLYWEVPTGRPNPSTFPLRDHSWATWTGIYGWHVKSIWPRGADPSDINAVDRSHDGNLLATADDFSHVKLFRFPAAGETMFYKAYMGHSSHVANVRFSLDDSYLLSVGGADCSILQWKCNLEEETSSDDRMMCFHWEVTLTVSGVLNPRTLGLGEDVSIEIMDSSSGKIASSGRISLPSPPVRTIRECESMIQHHTWIVLGDPILSKQPESIMLSHLDVPGKSWFLEEVTLLPISKQAAEQKPPIVKSGTPEGLEQQVSYPCYLWMNEKNPRQKLFKGDGFEYHITFFTNPSKNAGTTANIFVEIFCGSQGSLERHLAVPAIEKASLTEVTVRCAHALGSNIDRIVVRTDAKHPAEGATAWLLDKVVVAYKSLDKKGLEKVTFMCDRWLDSASPVADLRPGLPVDCSVIVVTSDMGNCGTDAAVMVELLSAAAKLTSGSRPLNPPNRSVNPFARNATFEFKISVPEHLFPISSVVVTRNGRGNPWFLDRVYLASAQDSGIFVCRKWLTEGSPCAELVRGIGNMECDVVVTTSDIKNADTDANVWVDLIGSKNSSGKMALSKTEENPEPFERGKTTAFKLVIGRDLGTLRSLQIGHDGTTPASRWHLDKVEVILSSYPSRPFVFMYQRWLDAEVSQVQLEPENPDIRQNI